jgi:hypothetical protein
MLYTGIDSDNGNYVVGCAESVNASSWSKRLAPIFHDSRLGSTEVWGFLERKDDYIVLYNSLTSPNCRQVYAASTKDFLRWTVSEDPLLPSEGVPDDIGFMKYCADLTFQDDWYYITASTSNGFYTKNAIGLWRTKRLDEQPEYLGEIIQRDAEWKKWEIDTPRIVHYNDKIRIYYSGRAEGRRWSTGMAEGTFE